MEHRLFGFRFITHLRHRGKLRARFVKALHAEFQFFLDLLKLLLFFRKVSPALEQIYLHAPHRFLVFLKLFSRGYQLPLDDLHAEKRGPYLFGGGTEDEYRRDGDADAGQHRYYT
ncbi:hypothetical protein SDC9_160504 [bioreactor metagenome]|uniref:Uncharacterized protein n=1 Tax=bioreactor metagenome TaxID=1076179 RepID=A0A645FL98_9ZZZZ